jgi:predicted hotdog family 3-hydroxylacyl-ACP dehydratase
MCLLDSVVSWDAMRIRCRSASHRTADNPLRSHGRLGAACGIEYVAQAMAVHGALVAASAPLSSTMTTHVRRSIDGSSVGYLASVRNVTFYVARLDDVGGDLVASAERLTGDARTVLYEFALWSETQPLLKGRAGIVIDPALGARLAGAASA